MIKTESPLVSIVIPTFNHARYLGRALQSVFDQTFKNWEIIVVDNHSTDHTEEVIASYSTESITYLKIHNNGVIAASRNAGINASKGKWIAFLDSDDWWTEDKLEICFSHVNEKVDLLHHDLSLVTEKSHLFGRRLAKSRQLKAPVLIDLIMSGNLIANSSVIVRKSLLKEIGGICEDASLIGAEDYNSWLRIANLTDNFVYIPKALTYYLKHNESVSNKNMSVVGRYAVKDFVSALNKNQKIKVEARFRYTEGRFNSSKKSIFKAKEDFLYCIKNGIFSLKVKSFISLLILSIK